MVFERLLQKLKEEVSDEEKEEIERFERYFLNRLSDKEKQEYGHIFEELFKVMSGEAQAELVSRAGYIAEDKSVDRAIEYVKAMNENREVLGELFKVMSGEAQAGLVGWAGEIAKDKSVDMAIKYVKAMNENREVLGELFKVMSGEAQAELVCWAGSIAEDESVDRAIEYVKAMNENREVFKVMSGEAQAKLVGWAGSTAKYESVDRVIEYVKAMNENREVLGELFKVMSGEAQAELVSRAGSIAEDKSVDRAIEYVKAMNENREVLGELFKVMSGEAQAGLVGGAGYIAKYESVDRVIGYVKAMNENREVLGELFKVMSGEAQAELVGRAGYIARWESVDRAIEYVKAMNENREALGELFKVMSGEAQVELVSRAGEIAKDKSVDMAIKYVKAMNENREVFKVMSGKAQAKLVGGAGSIAEDKSVDRAIEYVKAMNENREVFKVMGGEAQAKLVGWAGSIAEYESVDRAIEYVKAMNENREVLGELFKVMSGEAQAKLVSGAGYIARDKSVDKAIGYIKLFKNITNKKIKEKDLKRIEGLTKEVDFSANDLEKLEKEKGDVYEKARRLVTYAKLKQNGIEISKPSLSKEWQQEAYEKGLSYVSQKFGIDNPEVVVKEIDDVLQFTLIPGKYTEEVGELFNNIEKIEKEKSKEYKLGKVYHNKKIAAVKTEAKPEELVDYFVKAMIGRWAKIKPTAKGKLGVYFAGEGEKKRESIKLARELLSSFEGSKKLKQAMIYVRSCEKPEKIFKDIKQDYQKLKQGDKEAGLKILEYFQKKFVEPGLPEKVEPLSDIIDSIKGLYGLKTEGYVAETIEMEKPGIDFLFDSSKTSCCAFMPNGANKEASLIYLADRDVGLLKYKLVGFDNSKEDAGVAIMVKCKDKDGNKVLLVDSVEFNSALRDSIKGWREKFYDAILRAAKDSNVDYVVFNVDVANASPQAFNRMLESKGVKKKEIYLEKLHELPQDVDETYLEAFGGWEKPKGKVEGYIVEVK